MKTIYLHKNYEEIPRVEVGKPNWENLIADFIHDTSIGTK